MSLRYERSRKLDTEIEEAAIKWGYRIELESVDKEEKMLKVQNKINGASVSKTSIPEKKGNSGKQSEKLSRRSVCNQKHCYCRTTLPSETDEQQELSRKCAEQPRVTWDQVLSRNMDFSPPEKLQSVKDKSCQVSDRSTDRRTERPKSAGDEAHEQFQSWCHPECFVQGIIEHKPHELMKLKRGIDEAVHVMYCNDHRVADGFNKEFYRPKVVAEYLEDLGLEMVKKRLEETEAKYKKMKQKLGETLTEHKKEVERLKNELSEKTQEVGKWKRAVENERNLRDGAVKQRIAMLDDNLKSILQREEFTSAELDKYRRSVHDLKAELTKVYQERDFCRAKMEIYEMERDKAVAALSVYEKSLKNLKTELGQEMRGFRAPLDLTADSCGTLDLTEKGPYEVATSSPNQSKSNIPQGGVHRDGRQRRSPLKLKKTKHTMTGSRSGKKLQSQPTEDDKENAGEVLLQKLEVLGKEFKQFSENVIPLALGLDDEAKQLLNHSPSTGLSWTDFNSQSHSPASSTLS